MMPASVSDVGGLVLPPACQRPLAACQADSEPASHGETVSARLTVTAGRGTGPGGGSLRLSSTQPGFKLPAASHSDRDSCATPGATQAGSLGDSEALRLGPGLGLAGPAPRPGTRNFKSHCQAQVHSGLKSHGCRCQPVTRRNLLLVLRLSD